MALTGASMQASDATQIQLDSDTVQISADLQHSLAHVNDFRRGMSITRDLSQQA